MEYRLSKEDLLENLKLWNQFLKKKVHLIACGGTALTLLDVKASTKDVDFLVPNQTEYRYLVEILRELGYEALTPLKWKRAGELYEYDLFQGKCVHTTELMDSPLKPENHELLMELSYLYIGILNFYDLIITKLFRGTAVDFEDCLALVKVKFKEIDLGLLIERYKEVAGYEVAQTRVLGNLKSFLAAIKKEDYYG